MVNEGVEEGFDFVWEDDLCDEFCDQKCYCNGCDY